MHISIETSIDVMDQVVSLVHSIPNRSLHPRALVPRISVLKLLGIMRSEKGIERAQLVKLYKQLIRWFSEITRDVSPPERMPSDSSRQQHYY